LQVSHPVLGGNQGAGTVTYSYCHQMGHLFNRCTFVGDRLRQLFRQEVMNIHQPVLPTTTIVIPNVFILGTQAINPNIGHMAVLVNYQTTWSQPITPIVLGKTNMLLTSTYPMWYNVIPLFVPLDPSLYLTYPTKTKGLDSLLFKNYTSYVPRNVYLILEQPIVPPTYIPFFIGNQFPIVVQPVTSKDKQHVQQPVTTLVPTIVQVTTSLPTHIPIGSITNH